MCVFAKALRIQYTCRMLITLLNIPSALRIQSHSRTAIEYGGLTYSYQPFDPGPLAEAGDASDDRFDLRLRTKAPTIPGETIGEWLRRTKGAIGTPIRLLVFDVASGQLLSPASLIHRGTRSITKASMGATDCLLTIGSLSTPLDTWVGL